MERGVTEEQLSQLSRDDKLKVAQYLVADIAANLLGDDAHAATRARHDLGALVMTFSNLYHMATSEKASDARAIASISKRFRYEPPAGDGDLERG
jgi:hypothetical protein